MLNRGLSYIFGTLILGAASIALAAEPGAVVVQTMAGSLSWRLDRFTVNRPAYISQSEKTNFVALISRSQGVEFITGPPIRAAWGERAGYDITSSEMQSEVVTNQPGAVLGPIPEGLAGLFWRFTPSLTNHLTALDFEFACFEENEEGVKNRLSTLGRQAGALRFQSNEVAVIRLPQRRKIITTRRSFLSIPLGKETTVETNDLFLMVEVERGK